jgi:hypothetical protein
MDPERGGKRCLSTLWNESQGDYGQAPAQLISFIWLEPISKNLNKYLQTTSVKQGEI